MSLWGETMQFRYFLKILARANKFQIELEVVQFPIQTELGFDCEIEMFSLAKQSNIQNGNCFFLNIAFKFYV